MKKLLQTIFIALSLQFTLLHAGGAHSHSHDGHGHSHAHHEITKEEAMEAAELKFLFLLKKQKIPKSWKGVPLSSITKKKFNHAEEWVAMYENTLVGAPQRQKLYIFVSFEGKITGANYTGK